MRKTIFVLMGTLFCMTTTSMAQETEQPVEQLIEKSCQDYVMQFNKEVINLKADVTSLTTKLKADKGNTQLASQLKQKKEDLKIAQKNLKVSQASLKNEAVATKEIDKTKAQVAKLQNQKNKAEVAVTKAEQKVAAAEKKVSAAEKKAADAQQKVKTAQQDVEKAKDNVTKAKKAVSQIETNSGVNENAIKAAESKRSSAVENLKKSIVVRADGTSGR